MTYTSLWYAVLVLLTLILYQILPQKRRWLALLLASAAFYVLAVRRIPQLLLFGGTVLLSWLGGVLLMKTRETARPRRRALLLWVLIVLCAAPFVLPKIGVLFSLKQEGLHWILPMGLAFYTLQVLAYLADVYRGKTDAEPNLLKYALFISFFPQILQGPIPRFQDLQPQLLKGEPLRWQNLRGGGQLILWGLFLKYMIADRAAIPVNRIFDLYPTYQGVYILLGAALFLLQLYADFLACTTLAQGVAELFGIRLRDNFRQPFFSRTGKEFWGRWHLSLSLWLRDYVYFSLGGSRKGPVRKVLNLCVTFLASGIWHGGQLNYLIWGMMQAFAQVFGDWTRSVRERFFTRLKMPWESLPRVLFSTLFTNFYLWLSAVFFRADTAGQGLRMLRSLFSVWNPWVLLDGSLLNLGLGAAEWNLLALSLGLLFAVSVLQYRGHSIRGWVNRQHLVIRWGLTLLAAFAVLCFGSYGFGFTAQDFLYGAF